MFKILFLLLVASVGHAQFNGPGQLVQLTPTGKLPAIDGSLLTGISGTGLGTVTSVGLSLPSEITVTNSPVILTGTLTGTWASQLANKVFAAPNGAPGTPSFRLLVAADIPSLAASIITSGTFSTGVLPTIPETKGGTNQTAYALGDVLYSSATNTLSKLSGNITATKKFLTQTGTGVVSAAPTWGTIVAGDVPTLNQSTTGSAATLTTPRLINTVSFNGSADITVTAVAGTLTGTTLNSTVVTSSLTSVGTLAGLTVTNPIAGRTTIAGSGTTAATAATTGTVTVNMTTQQITITPTGACTFNAAGGTVGNIVYFVVTTSGVSAFVLTFNTNFKSVGTLSTGTVTAKKFIVSFLCLDGTVWAEICRTAAM